MGGEIPGRDRKALEARLVRTSPYVLREMLHASGMDKDAIMELKTERDFVDAVIKRVEDGKVVIPGLAEYVEPMKKEEAEMPKPKEAKGFDDFDDDGPETSEGSSDGSDLNVDFDEDEKPKEEEKPKRKAAKKEEKPKEEKEEGRKAETVGNLTSDRVEVLLLKLIETVTGDHERIVAMQKTLNTFESKMGLLEKILHQVFSAKRHIQYGLNRIFKIGDLAKLGNFKENVIMKAEEAAAEDLKNALNPPKREAAPE